MHTRKKQGDGTAGSRLRRTLGPATVRRRAATATPAACRVTTSRPVTTLRATRKAGTTQGTARRAHAGVREILE